MSNWSWSLGAHAALKGQPIEMGENPAVQNTFCLLPCLPGKEGGRGGGGGGEGGGGHENMAPCQSRSSLKSSDYTERGDYFEAVHCQSFVRLTHKALEEVAKSPAVLWKLSWRS